MFLATATHLPSFFPATMALPFHRVVVPHGQGRTESGLCHAVIMVPSRNLCEAVSIKQLAA